MRLDAHRPGVAVLVDVPGRSHPSHRGPRRAVRRRGSRGPGLLAFRSGRPAVGPAASRRPPGGRARCPTGSSRSAGPIGVESNGAVSNLAPTPYALTTLRKELRAMRPDVIHVHEPPAPDRRLRRDRRDRRAARRHVPLLLGERVLPRHRQRPVRRAPQAPAPARAHRGLRGRRVDRAALLRRALPHRSPTASRCPDGRARRRRRRTAARCGSRSSARRSSARACRSCCAPSRRCASTSRSSCSSSAPATRTSRR